MNLSEHIAQEPFFSDKIIMKNLDMDPAFEKKHTDIMKLTVVIKLCIVETR
jgi:hypothetical protein